MSEVVMDSKRRIVLPKGTEERYGQKFIIVRLPDEILLKPMIKDPLKAAQDEWKKLGSAKQLRKDFTEYMKRRTK